MHTKISNLGETNPIQWYDITLFLFCLVILRTFFTVCTQEYNEKRFFSIFYFITFIFWKSRLLVLSIELCIVAINTNELVVLQNIIFFPMLHNEVKLIPFHVQPACFLLQWRTLTFSVFHNKLTTKPISLNGFFVLKHTVHTVAKFSSWCPVAQFQVNSVYGILPGGTNSQLTLNNKLAQNKIS